MIVEYIDAHRDRLGVEPICRVLTEAGTQIAPSTYYAARTLRPSARSVRDTAATALIERVHRANYGVYGARKVHAQLRLDGHQVARCTVERLMRARGLRGISRAKGPRTTIAGAGMDGARTWSSGRPLVAVVEGTDSYGYQLTRSLQAAGIEVLGVNRPDRANRRRKGKSDPVDAEAAARSVLSGQATAVPKDREGAWRRSAHSAWPAEAP